MRMWNRMSSANNTVNSSIRSQSWSFESCLPDRITRRYNRCNDLSCSDWGSRNGKVEILNSAESKVASGSEESRSARERSGRRRRLEELRLHFGSKDAGGGSVQAPLNSYAIIISPSVIPTLCLNHIPCSHICFGNQPELLFPCNEFVSILLRLPGFELQLLIYYKLE